MGLGSGARRRRRAPSAVALLVTLVTLVATLPSAGAASSDELWERFDRASQAHADAEEQLAEVQEQLDRIRRSLEGKRQALASLEVEVRRLAIDRYVRAGSDRTDLLSLEDANEGAYREGLAEVVAGLRLDVLDAYDSAEEDLESDLRAADDLEALRADAVAASQATLATLADAARAAAAAEAKAREEAARQAALRLAEERAREEAARKARARAALTGSTGRTTTTAAGRTTTNTTRPADRTTTPTSPPVTAAPRPEVVLDPNGLTDDQLRILRQCESGDDYARSDNARYRGAYQFHRRTWDGVAVQAGRADLVGVDPAAASPADQDLMAQTLYRSAGLAPWPACGRQVKRG